MRPLGRRLLLAVAEPGLNSILAAEDASSALNRRLKSNTRNSDRREQKPVRGHQGRPARVTLSQAYGPTVYDMRCAVLVAHESQDFSNSFIWRSASSLAMPYRF